MTCREKLKIEYPDRVNPVADGGCIGCPKGYGYLPEPEYCKHCGDSELCTKCWDREIPEIEEIKEEVKMDTNKTYTFEDVRQMSEYEKTDLIMELQKDKTNLEVKCGRLNEENFGLKLENDLEKSIKSDRESFIEKIKKENTDLVDCIKKRNETIGSLKKENEKLQRDRDFLNLDTGRLNDEIKEKDKEIEKLKVENKNLEENNYVLNDHINEYEFVIKEQDKEKAKLKSDIERWNKSCEYLVEQNGALEKKVEDADACYRGRVVQCNELAEKVKQLKYERDRVDTVLRNKIYELEHAIKLKNKDIDEKDKFIEHLNEKNDDLLKRLDDQRKKIEDLENGDVLPYFIRKVVGDKLKVDPLCWATPVEKRSYIKDPYCKSVPCSEAIKQLENKVDDIPCIKAKNTKNELEDAIKDYVMNSPKPVCWDDYWPINHLGEWNITDPSYDKTATHMMRKYKALRNAGFDHDDAMGLIPVWLDE